MSQDKILLEKKENVYILTLNNPKANIIGNDIVALIHEKLDIVEKDPQENLSLIICSSQPKFFSAGLDLKYFVSLKTAQEANSFLIYVSKLLARILVFPIPTIAVSQGYCIAAGYLLTLACDYRFSAEENTLIQMNEVDMGATFPPGLEFLMRAKMSLLAHRNCIMYGKKYNGKEALKEDLIDFCLKQEILKQFDQARLAIFNHFCFRSSDF